ncbi:uncharacterized protein LOC135096645 [Scylla paramamosain]|uniref:uncharacterized protein LOC135096645 n=1 Tax=Scylla paramamosain TaxID=85552 RepID=UPI00308288DA
MGNMLDRLERYPSVFNIYCQTVLVKHDVDMGDAAPVKLPLYRVNPHKQQLLEEELRYMLDYGIIKRTYSEWSSPVTESSLISLMVRLCIDFRKVDSFSKIEIYPSLV